MKKNTLPTDSIAEASLVDSQKPAEKQFMCNPRNPDRMPITVTPIPKSSGKSSFLISIQKLKKP